MYTDDFCGKSGPRTIFTIQSCEGVSVKPFSFFPDEEEVLFRPLAHFHVTGSTKRLRAADLQDPPPPADQAGFPDEVHLQQLPLVPPLDSLSDGAASSIDSFGPDLDRIARCKATLKMNIDEIPHGSVSKIFPLQGCCFPQLVLCRRRARNLTACSSRKWRRRYLMWSH
eukprot:COSAG04_NODE_1108_length_8231_cov_5.606247_3_plen_169_part_00